MAGRLTIEDDDALAIGRRVLDVFADDDAMTRVVSNNTGNRPAAAADLPEALALAIGRTVALEVIAAGAGMRPPG